MAAIKVNKPTPFVPCMWAFLQQPKVSDDVRFKDTFEITVLLNGKDKEQSELLKEIAELHKKAGGKQKTGDKGHPIKFHATKEVDGDEVKYIQVPDVYAVRFKTVASARDHIPTFDMQGNDVWRENNYVANESIVRVQWSYEFYDMAGNRGVSLYLEAVQVKDLKEWMGKGFDDFDFDTGEGYTKGDDVEKIFDEGGETAEPGDDLGEQDGSPVEDDLPF